jgi:hypothetical protein
MLLTKIGPIFCICGRAKNQSNPPGPPPVVQIAASTRINAETLKLSYQLLGVKALILQFGGNALPGMKSPSSAEAYGKKFFEETV